MNAVHDNARSAFGDDEIRVRGNSSHPCLDARVLLELTCWEGENILLPNGERVQKSEKDCGWSISLLIADLVAV